MQITIQEIENGFIVGSPPRIGKFPPQPAKPSFESKNTLDAYNKEMMDWTLACQEIQHKMQQSQTQPQIMFCADLGKLCAYLQDLFPAAMELTMPENTLSLKQPSSND